MFLLTEDPVFPPVEWADEEGLLAIGGDLSSDRLLAAYRLGIFPWYNEGEPILWWNPDPRFVLFPGNLKISKSMQRILRNGPFTFTVDKDFSAVLQHCQKTPRKGQEGTWITPAIQKAYRRLHDLGHAHSAEAWMDGQLVGGIYGVRLGKVFFGESMFSTISNASKFAFIKYVELLQQENVQLIDCQVHTTHLESLGADMIPRTAFMALLNRNTGA
jgi:leucyl/phenylalanyl-tRNA---protein transferase